MSRRPTISLVDNPIAVSHGETVAEVSEPDPEPTPRRTPARRRTPAPKSAEPQPTTAKPQTNPYARMRKVQAPVRLFPPLWERLDEIVRELSDEGLEVDKTALLNAVLHFEGPTGADEARELVNRWRALLARPPAPAR